MDQLGVYKEFEIYSQERKKITIDVTRIESFYGFKSAPLVECVYVTLRSGSEFSIIEKYETFKTMYRVGG